MFDTYEGIFNERAGSYDDAMNRWPGARSEEFGMVLAPLCLAAGAVIGDMPAGGGYLRRYLPKDVTYVAVEPSAPFFERCPTDAMARRHRCDLHAVPLPQASMDHVVSVAGLHHVADLDAVFAEIRRLVRLGGSVVIVDVDAGSPTADFLNGFVDAHNPMGHAGVFFDDATVPRLRSAGLEVIDDRPVNPRWSFPDARQLGAYCKSLFGLERATVSQVFEGIDARFGCSTDADGSLGFGWPLRRLVCRRA